MIKNIKNLVYFMMCYKACVRTKVSLFGTQEVKDKDEKISIERSKKDFSNSLVVI